MRYFSTPSPPMPILKSLGVFVMFMSSPRTNLPLGVRNVSFLGIHMVKRVGKFMMWRDVRCLLVKMSFLTKWSSRFLMIILRGSVRGLKPNMFSVPGSPLVFTHMIPVEGPAQPGQSIAFGPALSRDQCSAHPLTTGSGNFDDGRIPLQQPNEPRPTSTQPTR